MNLNTETWGRDICELINYDSIDLYLNSIRIKEEGCLYRLNNRIFYTKDEVSFEEYEILLKIKKNDNCFQLLKNKYDIDENGNICSINACWFLLKKFKLEEKYNKYKIHTGDIIKIGRIIIKIKEIKYANNNKDKKSKNKEKDDVSSNITEKSDINKISNKIILKDIGDFTNEKEINNKRQKILSLANQRNATDPNLGDRIQVLTLNNNIINTNNNSNNTNNNNNINNKVTNINNNNLINDEENNNKNNNEKIKKINAVCRICYVEEEDGKEDPLVQPCQCSGSLKYIHLKCLKHWIHTRSCLKVEENDCCIVFLFKEVECEICKAKLPDLINHNGKLYSLLDFSEEFKNYVVLETLTSDEENNKFLYIISLDKKKEIKVGRGMLSEILLSDVSVSRIHCLLCIEGRNIYIKDNNSKFGTLVLVQAPIIKLAENLPLFLQVGRTYLNFRVIEETKLFTCCGVSENPNIFYHYNQNEKQVKLNRVLTVKNDYNNFSEEDDKEEEKKIQKENDEDYEEIKSKKSSKNEDNSIKIVIDNE